MIGRKSLIYLFVLPGLLIPSSAKDSATSNPYYPMERQIESLLPFSDQQLAVFKKLRVKKVEKIEHNYSGKREFLFDTETFLLKQEQLLHMIDDEQHITYDVRYFFDDSERLINVKVTAGYEKSGKFTMFQCDSVVYNEKGQLISYYQDEKIGKRRKKKYIYFDLIFKTELEGGSYVLEDKTSIDDGLQYLDSLGRYYRIEYSYHTDSIAYKQVNDTLQTKEYWYKTNSTKPEFRLGKTESYTKGNKIEEKIFSTTFRGKGISEHKTYTYSSEGQLLTEKDELRDKESRYSYDETGLLTHVTESSFSRKEKSYMAVESYRYFF